MYCACRAGGSCLPRRGKRGIGEEARLSGLPHGGQEDGWAVLQGRGGQVPRGQGSAEEAGAEHHGARRRRKRASEVDSLAEVRGMILPRTNTLSTNPRETS